MRITKRERYALRMMADLASSAHEAMPIGVRLIAERQDIAPRYLEQIAGDLRRAGLVRSKQGQTGGYVLARPSRDITVGQILEAVNGSAPMVECLGDDRACDRTHLCATRSFWAHVDALVRSAFDSFKLDDLLENRIPLAAATRSELHQEGAARPGDGLRDDATVA